MSDDRVDLLLESELNMDHGAWATCREAAVEILRLRAENEKLRAALKPFADMGLTEARKVGLWSPKSVITMYVNYENLSAAAAALKETGDE